jgi:tetratricopeptide (TPR) repeat protein
MLDAPSPRSGAQPSPGFAAAPVHPMVFETLAQLQQWGGFEQAVPIARALAEKLPGDARAQHLLAVICGQLNMTTDALAAVQRASALTPRSPMLEVFHASLEADARQHAAARDRLEPLLDRLTAAVAQPGPDHVDELRALFRGLKELARVLDALGEYDAVFPQLEAAASIASMLPEYTRLDAQLLPQTIAANAAGFTARSGAVVQHPAARAPVFVLGFFRSGTTLVQQVLRAHSGVFLSDEVGLLHSVLGELHRMQPGADPVPAKLARLDADALTRLRATYWRAAHDHHGPDSERGLFVDKFTLNTVDLALIDAIFPDARVLFVMRDPRDVCLSCVMQLMVPGPATMHLLRLNDAAALYAQLMRFWQGIRGQLTARWQLLRYEDAVTDFEATFRPVFDFMGLEWRPEVVDFHRHAAGRYVASPSRNQVAQPLFNSSLARWRRYENELAPVLPTLAPFIEDFGYPPA